MDIKIGGKVFLRSDLEDMVFTVSTFGAVIC